jgi:hypothetical protein
VYQKPAAATAGMNSAAISARRRRVAASLPAVLVADQCLVELGNERRLAAVSLRQVGKVGAETGLVAGAVVGIPQASDGLDRLGVAVLVAALSSPISIRSW